MEDTIALYLAIKEIKASPESKGDLKNYKNKLEEYGKEANSNSNSTIELCYSMIFYPKGNELKYITIQNGLEGAKNLPHKVYLALKKANKILEDLLPSFISDRVLQNKIITFSDLYERFQNNPSLPLPKNRDVLRNSVNSGVEEGLFAIYGGSMQDITENNEINLCKFDSVASNFMYKKAISGGVKDAYHILPKAMADELSDKLNEIVENTKICSSCKGRNSLNAVKCSCCGEPFEKEEFKICPHCKAENPLDVETCVKCGELFTKAPEVDLCPGCGFKNPKGTKKCEKCGKWFVIERITSNSVEDFLEKVEGENFKLKMVEFRLSNIQTLHALKFKLPSLTTGYNPKITASMKGENADLKVKDAERIDINELTDIIQRLSNLVQEEVLTTLKLEYEEGIEVSYITDTFKSFKVFDDDMEFKAAASTI
jgi:ribosomal protein L40E